LSWSPMTILDHSLRASARISAFALAGALLTALPAEARLHDPGLGGPASGGSFNGVAVRPQAPTTGSSAAEPTGLAGNCYTLRQVVRDRLGASFLRSVRVCE
jgi:hypothetical protein